jgi:class 3 adenylate cyclase/tetratricopeptide (TPR) repeat protein
MEERLGPQRVMPAIEQWLRDLGLERHARVLVENDIDLDVLADLGEQDLERLGVSLGDRKRILKAITRLRTDAADASSPAARAEPERRHLTFMFCDLVGSTALSARLDPEDLHQVIAAYQDCCRKIIQRFEGHIGHFVGDGMLVYFGYPQAHEDNPQRAVRAGLEIAEAVHGLESSIAALDIPLAVRIGIHTGLVVVGDIGTGDHRDVMAVVGESPNVAARLQELAEPGTVLVGSSTHRLVEGLFLFDDLGPRQLKGIAEPVPVYRVREASDTPTRFEASAVRGLTPLVGRQRELHLLLERWKLATRGEGQVVLLSGEPGIGKSRLIQTLRARLQGEPHTMVRAFCSPFYVSSALHPFLDQLERAAGLNRTDPPDLRLDKLEALLGQATARSAEAVAVLAPLMAIPTQSRYPPLELTPQQRRARAFDVLLGQMEGLASQQPLLGIVEDAQWIDPSSVELLHRMVDRVRDLPALVLVTFRAEFEPPWTAAPHVTSLSLDRLSHRQAAALAEQVTGGKPLPWKVLEQIVARTDGVPLFVEELTKTMLESGLLEEAGDRYVLHGPLPPLAIPASLQDSLMARLDRLAPVKELAQLAAALGRIFTHELLEAVSPLKDPALSTAVSQLIEAELLYQRGAPPNVVYDFKHALVQDAAYASMLRSRRQQLHLQIGTILEQRFPETIEAKPELLSRHFELAGLPARAIPYALTAGDLAVARYAGAEARARYQETLVMARALAPSEEATRWQIEATVKLASVAANRREFEADLEDLAGAAAMAQMIGDRTSLCRIRYWTGRMNYVLGRFDLGVRYAGEALRMAEALGADDDLVSSPVNLLARLHCLRGEPREAIAHARRNVVQMQELGNRIEEAAISGVLAFACGMHGRFAEAFDAAEHGVALAKQLDHLPTLAACLHFRGVVRGWHGDLATAVPSFEEAITIAENSGDVFRQYLAHGWRGEALLHLDRSGPAEADLGRCLALGDRIGTSFHRGAFEAFLARIRLLEGKPEAALEIGERALAVASDTNQAWSRSIALRIHAEILLALGPERIGEAADAVREAIEIQERRSCRFDLAWSRLIEARVLDAAGGSDGAAAAAAEARRLFEEMGLRHEPR